MHLTLSKNEEMQDNVNKIVEGIMGQTNPNDEKMNETLDTQFQVGAMNWPKDDGNKEEMEGPIRQEDLIFQPDSQERNWLLTRGKGHFIYFKDEERKLLRMYFDSLDDDGSGSIGVDEMEDPLIALGLVENRAQVQKIVDAVDDDGTGNIEFNEFLSIIKGGNKNKEGGEDDGGKAGASMDENTKAIFEFFKKLVTGEMKTEQTKNIPFSLFISLERRRMILKSIMGDPNDRKNKEKGDKILSNYKKQIAERMAREEAEAKGMFSTRTKSVSQQSARSARSK